MNKQNGFIATSLLYSFFLVFVTLFIGMVTLYLQNRIYLTKFEDSSKNSIYIREMKEKSISQINYENSNCNLTTDREEFTFNGLNYKLSNCEIIYSKGDNYYAEECSSDES